MATNESSGRWDASGSFNDAVATQRVLARGWANSLTVSQLRQALIALASDRNAFTLYEQNALMIAAAFKLEET